jgi:hypothetical protein
MIMFYTPTINQCFENIPSTFYMYLVALYMHTDS